MSLERAYIRKKRVIKIKWKVCDLCGTVLKREEYLFDIRDARDPYIKYHAKHWSVCDDCFEELEERRHKVHEEVGKPCNPGVILPGEDVVEF